MAIYHLSCRPPVSRAIGKCATAAAAYRAGCSIRDERTGLVFDYRHRHGVVAAHILLPGGTAVADRAQFWNSVELHHRRKDAVTAREVIVALPHEIDVDSRAALAARFARDIVEHFSVGVDYALHEPSLSGDVRNFHCHVLMTACSIDMDGKLGRKCEALDPIACRRSGFADSASWLRPHWEKLVNDALENAGSLERIDHRSFKKRKIDALPGIHIGWRGASALARGSQNNRIFSRNVRARWIDADIDKLMRIRARLAESAAPKLQSPAFRQIKLRGCPEWDDQRDQTVRRLQRISRLNRAAGQPDTAAKTRNAKASPRPR